MSYKAIGDIRYANALILLKMAGNQKSLVQITGRPQSQISQLMGKTPTKPIGNAVARSLEQCFSKPFGWMDQVHYDSVVIDENCQVADVSQPQYNLADNKPTVKWLPHISWRQAAQWQGAENLNNMDNCKWVPAHKDIGPRSFVLTVQNDAMVSSYVSRSYPEEALIFVDTDVISKHGDYVVARLTDSGDITFKKLVQDGSQKFLIAINPSMSHNVVCDAFDVIGVVKWGVI
jgi:SOS-response transcriptional repressor LexA